MHTVNESSRRGNCRRLLRWLSLLILLSAGVVQANSIQIAVASNFLVPLQEIAAAFQTAHQVDVRISPGATGTHYAQIVNGAPFDVFLAADQARPQRLVDEGLAVADSLQTYAQGRLVLWVRPEQTLSEDGLAGLDPALVRRFAIANPRTAPYGAAAQQALAMAGLDEVFADRLVYAENVTQVLQFLSTGNVTHALVAASHTAMAGQPEGEWILVREGWHDPIRQDAVLLQRAADNPAAVEFLDFLKGDTAVRILMRYGYDGLE